MVRLISLFLVFFCFNVSFAALSCPQFLRETQQSLPKDRTIIQTFSQSGFTVTLEVSPISLAVKVALGRNNRSLLPIFEKILENYGEINSFDFQNGYFSARTQFRNVKYESLETPIAVASSAKKNFEDLLVYFDGKPKFSSSAVDLLHESSFSHLSDVKFNLLFTSRFDLFVSRLPGALKPLVVSELFLGREALSSESIEVQLAQIGYGLEFVEVEALRAVLSKNFLDFLNYDGRLIDFNFLSQSELGISSEKLKSYEKTKPKVKPRIVSALYPRYSGLPEYLGLNPLVLLKELNERTGRGKDIEEIFRQDYRDPLELIRVDELELSENLKLRLQSRGFHTLYDFSLVTASGLYIRFKEFGGVLSRSDLIKIIKAVNYAGYSIRVPYEFGVKMGLRKKRDDYESFKK